MTRLLLLLGATLAAAQAAPLEGDSRSDQNHKGKRPSLNVRATPRMAFSPVNVFLTAELSGGEDVEEYYCPEVEWLWGDGGKSVKESDCPPYEEGASTIERRFTADHLYRRAGNYSVAVTLRRANKVIARAEVKVTIRPGLNDPRE